MKMSRRVALDSVQLDELNPAIVIRSVDPGTPHETISAADRMGGYGQRITAQHWQTLEITVKYAIDVHKESLAIRRQIFDTVCAWAMKKGWLTVNWMQGKKMHVDKTVIQSCGDMRDWTAEYTIVFRAYGVPFWIDDTATVVEIGSEDSGSGWINVPGAVETICDVELTNGSGDSLDSVSVRIGDSVMSFTDLGLADGKKLVIGHSDDGLLYIRKYTGESTYVSVMEKRTTGSSDDMVVSPGQNLISITGSGLTATVSCRGRYV